jgi:hypothetical protein
MNVSRINLYQVWDQHPELKAEYEKVKNQAIDTAESEAIRRAVDGVVRPVFHQGTITGYERVYSDQLLSRVLAAYRHQWRSSSLEMSGPGGGAIPVAAVHSLSQKIVADEKTNELAHQLLSSMLGEEDVVPETAGAQEDKPE